MTKLEKYARQLGIKSPTATATPIDIEAGKAGYEKYLADSNNGTLLLSNVMLPDAYQSALNQQPKGFFGSIADYLKGVFNTDENVFPSQLNTPSVSLNTSGRFNFKVDQELNNLKQEAGYAKPREDWTDEERWAFGEKYATNRSAAFEFAEELNNAKDLKKRLRKEEALAEKSKDRKLRASLDSMALNYIGGFSDLLRNTAEYISTGEIDPEKRNNLGLTERANVIQGSIAQELNDKYGTIEGNGVFGGKGWGDVYGLGMSIGQSVAAGATGAVGMASMFGMAASNATSDALERGVSSDRAMAIGAVAGAAEMVLEKVSFKKLLGIASKEGVQNVFKTVLKQAGQEAWEEGATSVINEVADRILAADRSNYQLTVNALMAQGMSQAEAEKEAGRQVLNGIIYDTIAGAASGGISAGGAIGVNQVRQRVFSGEANAKAKELYTPIQQDLIAEGKQHKTSEKYANKLEKKLDKGKELSGYDLRTLAYETENAARTDDVETTRKAIVEKMKAEGLSDAKAKRLGEIALNKAIGHEVSKVQELQLKNNEIAKEVYRQISKEGMENNSADSEWARQTPIAELREEFESQNTKVDENVLKSSAENDTIEATKINGGNENGNQERVYLRDSGKWDGGKNTEGQVSRMESGSRQAERRQETDRVADREATRLVNEGRKVKVSDLGLEGGSTEQTVRLVARSKETTSMQNARKEAEARGLKVKFFVGDNLNITDEAGDQFSARAYIKGENVYVRADHPLYTSEQLMRHELGHDKIAKGEVDIKAVRDKLSKKVGTNNVTLVADLYNEAYAGTGMTAEEIWEECICDSLGEMNIFASDEFAGEILRKTLPEISKAAKTSKSSEKTRGLPDGKASRRLKVPPTDEYATNAMIWAYSDKTELGEQKLFHRNGKWVLLEKSDDGFVEMGSYTDKQRERFIEEIITRNEELHNRRRNGEIRADIDGYRNVKDEYSRYFADDMGQSRGDGQSSRLHRGESQSNGVADNQGSESGGRSEIKYSSPEEAKESGKVSDAKFSIEFAEDIANKQRQFANERLSRISSEELEKAISDTAQMVEEMKPYANILPQDKVGKTLVKNGSYDVSVENTTVCIRTLAYNSFVDMVSEKVGRPLTQMESFLVSQKLYEIAKEPQCLYCYVSLDRKAFNEMVIRYTEQRDAAIKAYKDAGKPKIPAKFDAEWSLFKKFLDGRKATTNMWDRYVGWLTAYNKGEKLVSLADISTEAKRLELVGKGGETASQVKDILKYAQSASWAKKQTQYVAYYDEILKLKSAVIRNLNSHYGMRWYSFSDYSGAFIVENMQQITDASIRGLKGLSYTKDTDFAEIFAPTGMNINISVYAKKTENGYEIDAKQSADIKEAIKLRKQYPNVGIVVVATDKGGVEWALAQEWSDVVIPFHTVRTGSDVAEFYNWEIFNSEQSDTVSDQNLWDAYVNEIGKKKASKMVYPNEHQNDRETYLSICKSRGLTPRFKSFLDNPNYMKLVNETRQSESETSPLKPVYNIEAAKRSFAKFVDKGGYYEGWYNDGIDVDAEADIVAEDVKAGKKANEVKYGRQDIDYEAVSKTRKTSRQHGKASRELDTKSSYAPTFYSHMSRVIDGIKAEKMGANDVVPYLKGKGVKDEEIKWSGIETFFDGKKSVTKAELQEFVAGSQLRIEEASPYDLTPEMIEMPNGDYRLDFEDNDYSVMLYKEGDIWVDSNNGREWSSPEEAYNHYRHSSGNRTRWSQYKLDGGSNYRELLFKMPNSTYSNSAMRTHWGEDAKGILAHARIQDMTTSDGKKMLFVEEIQSDWHNAGNKSGYVDLSKKVTFNNTTVKHEKGRYRLYRGDTELYANISDEALKTRFPNGITEEQIHQGLVDKHNGDLSKAGGVDDAPFRNNYHEYVLKRLLRMAAEEGYDSIGWTTADMQSERWSEEYAEGYRIEYDQDIPKFLRKYGKKWGAKVEHSVLEDLTSGTYVYKDKATGNLYTPEEVFQKVKQIVEAEHNVDVDVSDIEIGITGAVYVETYKDTYIPMEVDVIAMGTIVWSMDIPDSMKDSVLHEGQPKFSRELDTTYLDAVNRGDMETAQRMVDEVAKANGYTIKGMHATNAEFTEFDISKTSDINYHGKGIYFTNSLKDVENNYENYEAPDPWQKIEAGAYELLYDKYGYSYEDTLTSDSEIIDKLNECYDEVIDKFKKTLRRVTAYLKFDNPLVIDKHGKIDDYDMSQYDGIIDKHVYETIGQSGMDENTIHYIVFNPKNIKSADPVTYDAKGNVIPLSERFNKDNNDIRYSRETKPRTTVTTESTPYVSPTASSIVMDIDSGYDYTKRDKVSTAYITTQIMLTNAQAGIEHRGRKYGVDNIESLVQAARTASSQAQEMLSGNQLRIGSDTKEYQGEGLEKIARPIFEMSPEKQRAFYDYLFHQHNADRMSLERRSIEWNEETKQKLATANKTKDSLEKEMDKLFKERSTLSLKNADKPRKQEIDIRVKQIKAELRALKKQITALNKQVTEFVALKNKPVLGLDREAVAARKEELAQQMKELVKERQKIAKRKGNNTKQLIELTKQVEELRQEMEKVTDMVSEKQSREIIAKYESTYDDFIGIAEKIWNYNKNLNQYRVDTGLIDQDTFDYLNKLYPHYVPTYRSDAKTGIAAIKGKNNVAVSQSIKGAKGSTKDLLNPIVIMARQTMETVRAGRINQIAGALYEGAKGDKTYIAEVSRKKVKKSEAVDIDPMELRPKNNQVTFFKNGERITLQVSSDIFAGFDAFTPDATPNNPLKRLAAGVMNTFKKLVTSWNPTFLARNAIRDIQDAGINSKYGAEFAKAYKDIIAGEIRNDGEYWRLFKAMGGVRENYFDFDKGFQKQQTKRGYGAVRKDANAGKVTKVVEGAESIMQRMENLNNLIETLPRFAEFIASIKSGNTAEQAMLDAADVTTNFSRVGTVTKVANKYFIPFLNPAVQGASKAIRNITDAAKAGDGKKILVAYMKLAAKATIIGILPMLLNGLMYNDDEEYEDLRETDKENNFLIKIGGKFWKLPRGRMASVIGGLLNRAVFADEFDFKGYVANISTQMSPVESASRTIFSPFVDVKNNVTWYGSAIEGKQFENLAPAKRYDESTSSIAIAMAKALNGIGIEASPKKIHYLLDQYSGVVGDFVLPATTNKAEKDFISGNFTIDPVTSNKLSDKFYDMYYEAQYAKNDNENDKVAEYQVKHLNRVKSAISEMYEEKSKIQNSTLSDKAKREQTEAIQILINEMYKTAIEDFDLITNAIKSTSGVKDEYRYAEVIRLVYGAEEALEVYNTKVYEKSTLLKEAGISYDTFYNYYFSTRDIESDKDKKGNTISGSKKKKVVEKIDKLDVSNEKKLLLIALSGYSFDDASEKEKLLKYINSLKISAKSKRELADLLDFEYKNGKITSKS
jgi:hypothetical protein